MSHPKKSIWAKLIAPIVWIFRAPVRLWRWYKSLYQGAPWWKKLGIGFFSFIFFILFTCFAIQINLFWLFGRSPSLSSIMHPKNAAASEVYSSDGKLLGKFFSENRTPVPYDSIAPAFVHALISTEDERFYSHHGVDFVGAAGAMKDALRGHARGASTISQQLVKNMFRVRTEYSTGLLGYIPGVKILIMKLKEMIIATELEMFCTKNEILTMYANTVDFGSNAYGIKTAAKTYFNTTPAKLKTEEAAVLVGLLKATSAYNPKSNPRSALQRRNVVLHNMYTHGSLTQAEYNTLKEKPIELKFSVESAYDGNALYFRQAVAEEMKALTPDLDPYKDGLKIYTTVDSRMQRYAEEAVSEQMRNVQKNFEAHWGNQDPWVDEKNQPIPNFLQEKLKQTDAYKMLSARHPEDPGRVLEILNTPHPVKLFTYDGPIERVMSSVDSLRFMLHYMHAGFVAIEPQTGEVKAYVGDVDFNTWQHDNVSATHQPGSTFKLFVYATAIKMGWLPSDARLQDSYIRMNVTDENGKPSVWTPHNANGRFSGAKLSLRTAFAQSVNTIAVKLGQEVGISNVIKTAQDMGIKTELRDAPSLPLGASDVNLTDLVGAYASVANCGEHNSPYTIEKIEDSDGKVVYEHHRDVHTVLNPQEAYYMQALLNASVSDAGGTSQSLVSPSYIGQWYWNKSLDVGGKTGTSNSHADAWFVGVTPKLVGGAWVGGEYRQIHFRSGALGQGSRTALPIFGLFMRKVLSDRTLAPKYLAKYPVPEGINPADIAQHDEPVQRHEEPKDSLVDPDAPYKNLEENANQESNSDRSTEPSGDKPHSSQEVAEPSGNTPQQSAGPGTTHQENQGNKTPKQKTKAAPKRNKSDDVFN